MQCNSIGVFNTNFSHKYDVPRQGVFFKGHPGIITLNRQCGYEQALRDLDGFDRIWLIFQFHQNQGWRPTARPPIPPVGQDRVGVFASRSPYRPNSLGLSCVRLLKVNGLEVHVDECDLLDETPILDIKPYIPKVDAFPEALAGWVDRQEPVLWQVSSSPFFQMQSDWVLKHLLWDLQAFAQVQLGSNPFDDTRKRIKIQNPEVFEALLSYRTFRILFSYEANTKKIRLIRILSAYSEADLKIVEDRYVDKEMHRRFNQEFDDKKCHNLV
ncbi:MAG TPA: tRNA (N6-threonylcarbamoyladenosine(37)-N6)-methyltransferase TrmO [Fibrobacter sp.]|nr:tRNA (N6-threonylcarbamoyladenosine(37)-N6)-methyltransferase TrmO [Fibrobacter sp.]